ncbi:unnamed protein product [Prunus armeniaca]
MEINTLFAENGGRRREIERWENSVKTGELAAADSGTAVRWRGRVGSFGNGLEDRGGVWRWLWRLGKVAVEENSKGEGVSRDRGVGRARERERNLEFKNPISQNYNFAPLSILIVYSSIQLGFEPTTCLRTHLDVLYTTIQLKFLNSFLDQVVTIPPYKNFVLEISIPVTQRDKGTDPAFGPRVPKWLLP